MKDYYRILMVHPEADDYIVTVAYRRLAQQFHPDVYKGEDAHERMTAINEAYEVLRDPQKRAEYDASHGKHGGTAAAVAEEPMPASWRQIMVAERLLNEIEEKTQVLKDDQGSIQSRQFAESLYQECLNVIRFLDSLQGDEIEREAIDYMRASAHITAAMVRLNRPGFKDLSNLNFGGSTLGSIATLAAWGVGGISSRTQEKQNYQQALWHYQTSYSIYETPLAHLMTACLLMDMKQSQAAIGHFQRVAELDSNGEMGIEASKELMKLGVFPGQTGQAKQYGGTMPVPPAGSGFYAGGLLSYAGFGPRVGAALIDSILLTVVGLIVTLPLMASGSTGAAWFFSLAISFAYFAGMESSPLQATVGKLVFGLRVADLEGKRIDVGRAAIKHLLRLLTTLTAYLCIGVLGWLMVAFTKRKQAFYELASGTVTLVGRAEKPIDMPSTGAPYSASQTGSDLRLKCSKCGSDRIESSKRGWTFGKGLIGSNQTVMKCTNCGRQFEPGR